MTDLISRDALKDAINHEMDMQDLYLPAHFLYIVDSIPSVTTKNIENDEKENKTK